MLSANLKSGYGQFQTMNESYSGLLRLSLRLSLCAKPARAARQMKTRPAASPSKFQSVYTARRRARCMRGRALRTSACAWPQAAAGGEKRAINSARAIREVTSREPRLGGSLSNRLRLGLDGRRASLMEMSARTSLFGMLGEHLSEGVDGTSFEFDLYFLLLASPPLDTLRRTPLQPDRPKFRSFFSLSRLHFALFVSLWGRGHQMCTFGVDV